MANSFQGGESAGHRDARHRERAPILTSTRGGLTVLDFNRYVPFLLAVLANAWQHRTSAHYRRELGLGVTDWRVISTLCIEPGATGGRICEVIRHDKSSVSRALNALAEAGYLTYESAGRDPRRRCWHLSDAGRRTHERLLRIALENEAALVDGIPPEALQACLAVLRRMLANIESMPDGTLPPVPGGTLDLSGGFAEANAREGG